jgi:hypothetical protein
MSKIVFTVECLRDAFLAESHGLTHGQGPARVFGDQLPGGLIANTRYWVIVPMMLVDGAAVTDPDAFQLATSARNALERWPVAITTPGIGPFTLQLATD